MYRAVLSVTRPAQRRYTTSAFLKASFGPQPAPFRLSDEEQKIFEDLQKDSTGAFSTSQSERQSQESLSPDPSRPRPQVNQSPEADVVQVKETEIPALDARIKAKGQGEELHPDIRRGTAPEFDGERNPKTGEVGGPKNEPLRWGGDVDWSYNGRVTDF